MLSCLDFFGTEQLSQSSAPPPSPHKEPSRVSATLVKRWFCWVQLPFPITLTPIPFVEVAANWRNLSYVLELWLEESGTMRGFLASVLLGKVGSTLCLITQYIYKEGDHRCWVASHNERWLYLLTFLVLQIKWKKCWMLPDESIIKSRLLIIKGKYQRNLKS